MITLYQTIKIVSGIITAAPLVTFGFGRTMSGQPVFGIGLMIVGFAVYFFPGWLLDKYIEKIKHTIPFI